MANAVSLGTMLQTTINTFLELDKWLSDNGYFEDGHVLKISHDPLIITVGYNVKGNYKANAERYILSFRLIPSTIIDWTYDKTIYTGDDNYIEGIEPLEVERGVGIEFSTPNTFRLITESLTIEEQELIKTTFKPWASDKEMSLSANYAEIPKPQYWKEKLAFYGHDILFRYYAGEKRLPEHVPYPDYEGYYIQLTDRISSTKEGIFLKHLKTENNKLRLVFENKDEDLKYVWDDLTIILSDFPDAKINSGNCEFTGPSWKQYLQDKILPTVE